MTKTILITGSTDGIGKLAALRLAKDGHRLYLHGRNSDKLASVVSEIKSMSNNENISGFTADFSNLAAVKNMAAQIKKEIPKLDILINNAGVYKSAVAKTVDGLDIRFAVNYFAPYILTKELLPTIKNAAASRIINLSSAAQAPVSTSVLVGQELISTHAAYAQSKLALTMWSLHLAMAEPNITVIPVNPGSLLNTNMVREGFGHHRSSADKGGDILYDLALSPNYEGDSGKYFDNDIGAFGAIHPAGNNSHAINTLIKETDEFLYSV